MNRNVTRKLALSLAKKSVSNGFVDINWQFFKPPIVDNYPTRNYLLSRRLQFHQR